jgi:signal peptidase II
VVVDQLTKWWALNHLQGGAIHVVWTVQLNLARNTGAAFSRFGGQGPVIAVLALVVVSVLLWQGTTVESKAGSVAIGLVLGGAVGNLLDRAFRGGGFLHGAVVDFIDLQWWPVFNVADSCVVVGALLLIFVNVVHPGGHD